jgi:hypothetical protein
MFDSCDGYVFFFHFVFLQGFSSLAGRWDERPVQPCQVLKSGPESLWLDAQYVQPFNPGKVTTLE